jgi:hypothetical protein
MTDELALAGLNQLVWPESDVGPDRPALLFAVNPSKCPESLTILSSAYTSFSMPPQDKQDPEKGRVTGIPPLTGL